MSECRFCSAPVDRRTGFCRYCRSRLELDLHGGLEYRLYAPDSERRCPHCAIALTTIDLKIEKKFLIEKCNQCSGLFFDPGELEMLLDRSVSNVFHVNQAALNRLQTEHFQSRDKEFKYIKCPACQVIMNRRAFGYKSGVIVDHCRQHGFWLDEGELRQLQEWKKAGGELRQTSSNRDTRGQARDKNIEKSVGRHSSKPAFSRQSHHFHKDDSLFDLLRSFLD